MREFDHIDAIEPGDPRLSKMDQQMAMCREVIMSCSPHDILACMNEAAAVAAQIAKDARTNGRRSVITGTVQVSHITAWLLIHLAMWGHNRMMEEEHEMGTRGATE